METLERQLGRVDLRVAIAGHLARLPVVWRSLGTWPACCLLVMYACGVAIAGHLARLPPTCVCVSLSVKICKAGSTCGAESGVDQY